MSSGDGKEVSFPENQGKTELNSQQEGLESKDQDDHLADDLPSVPVFDASGDHSTPSNTIATASDDSNTTSKVEDHHLTDALPSKAFVDDSGDHSTPSNTIATATDDSDNTSKVDDHLTDDLPSEAFVDASGDHSTPSNTIATASDDSDTTSKVEDHHLTDDLPSKAFVDASGDHTTPSNTIATASDDFPVNATETLPDNTGGSSYVCMEVSKENSEKEIVEININQSNCEDKPFSDNNTEPPVVNIGLRHLDISPSSTEDPITLTKPKFLDNVGALASDDVDSNQDEELVLKWDDDEEEDLLLKDDEIDKNADDEASTPNLADDGNKIANTDEIDNIINDTQSKDVESITDVKSSEDDVLDDDEQDDIMSEIDAQIAELGASISKAENEGLMNRENTDESRKPMKNNSTESIKPSKSTSEQIIEIDMTEEFTEETTKQDQIRESSPEHSKKEETAPTALEIYKTLVNKPESKDKQTELEIKDSLLDDKNVSQNSSDLVNLDNLKQIENITTPDPLVMSTKTETNINQIVVSSVTQDKITEKSQEETVIKIDIKTVADVEDTDLSLDQNIEEDLLKDTEMQANSTTIDVDDIEMETSNKDGSFTHDSSNSFEEKQHGVNKPNVMLEIPTQELINLDDSVIDKEMSVDQEPGNVSVDLPDGKNEPHKSNEEIVLKTNTVEKETLKENVLVEQPALKYINVISDAKCTSSNQLDNCISKESVPKNDAVSLESVTSIVDAITKSDESPAQDSDKDSKKDNIEIKSAAESNLDEDRDKSTKQSTDSPKLEDDKINGDKKLQEQSTIQEDSTLSKVDAPETVSNVDVPKEDEISLPEVSASTESKVTEVDSKPEDSLPIPSSKDISSDSSNEYTEVQPSTSQMELQPGIDASDDAAEVTDSLGLLAESSRVRDEDDGDADGDGDDQETSEHDYDDDDFDPDDESSNQQTAEHSEEDSAQQSESDLPKIQPNLETEVADLETEVADLETEGADLETDVADTATDADKAFDMLKNLDKDTVEAEGEADSMDIESNEVVDKEADGKELELEISNVVSGEVKETEGEIDIEDDIVCEEVEIPSDNVEVEETEAEVDVSALKDTADETTTEVAENKEIPIKVFTDTKHRELVESQEKTNDVTKSPSKKKLEIAKPKHIVNIVDLESSSDDEVAAKPSPPRSPSEVTSVNISSEIEVMSSGDNTSNIVSKQGETVITLPKANAHHKITSRLNTSEITIKTASQTESTLVIPETTMGASKEESKAPKFGALEVFNLDSDDEESPAAAAESPHLPEYPSSPAPSRGNKCANPACSGAPAGVHYDARRKRRALLCENCLNQHITRATNLVYGIKSGIPLLKLEEPPCSQELVEISDSDDDEDAENKHKETIGEETAGMLERDLADIINATWEKFKMDAKLQEAQDELTLDLDRLEKESAEVSAMLDSCQVATDKLRGELYATFAVRRHQLPPFIIYDTPDKYFMCPEQPPSKPAEEISNKRRLSSASESQAKKPAIALGGPADTKLEDNVTKQEQFPILKSELMSTVDKSKIDDDKDVSVVTLSAESAPADLPPCGEPARPPLRPGQTVYAMRSAFGYWIKASVLEVTPKTGTQNFTQCRIKYENKTSRNAYKTLPARCLAYHEPANVRMTIGTRVVALFKDTSPEKNTKQSEKQSFSSGIVAEVPNPVNKYRYLIFFDDGYAQYVQHADTRLVCECAALVWEEVHPFSREFVRQYLTSYPERPMVRLHTGQSLKTEWNGKWWLSRVLEVDASLVHVYFEQDKRTEWIYRGSTRLAPLYLELQAAEKHRARPLPRNRQNRLNMPYVEYTRLDEQESASQAEAQIKAQQEEIRRQRAVAKKSTTPINLPPQQPAGNLDAVTSRVVYYTPKNAVKPYKMVTHNCGPKCKRTDVLALKDLRTYNPLAKPLLSGWERQIVRFKGHKEVMYRAPCGRRLRNMAELHRYLRTVNSDMGVDLFDFGPNTHCLAEFVLNKCIVGKKDLSHGKENVPVPCVNYYDESLPEFCSYNTERTPTAGVPLNVDPEFLCGCDCTDDCQDKSKCACWKMTLEGARTIGMDASRVGYVYKRLPDPLPSGIYECNARCKCRATCLNRVAQHPLQLKLQVFKTLNRGWGIRALNDVPKGSFLCIYAGNLLTDATANLDGLNEGDEYLAELDYIEVVEQMKEGYEDDIPEQDKKLDRKESGKAQESESEESESEEEANNSKSDADDGDFEPGFIPGFITGFNKRLRKRDKKKQKERQDNGQGREGDEDCITISDDEELREPSRFAAQAGMGGEFISKYRSVRTLFGKDEACYIMDAKVQGNIGRYLNHSCSPNVFVQNVFVDTHDPRFPWVAFFALTHIRAGTELTWNYNYDVGSVPGKALYCYCGAPNCRGRLL